MALVVLLRGVNVGGHRTFRPTELVRRLKHLEAFNIGAAGTLVIRKPVSQAELRAELARGLPFETEIMICGGGEFARMMSRNPFGEEPARPDVVRFVSVMSRRPRSAPPTPLGIPADRGWLMKVLATDGRFAFGVYRRHPKVIGYLGTLDRRFGVPVTTRNWNTVAAIVRALEVGKG